MTNYKKVLENAIQEYQSRVKATADGIVSEIVNSLAREVAANGPYSGKVCHVVPTGNEYETDVACVVFNTVHELGLEFESEGEPELHDYKFWINN